MLGHGRASIAHLAPPAARGRTLLELAFAWLLAKPSVASVIAGASTPEQMRQNAGAVSWTLGADELAEVDRITGP